MKGGRRERLAGWQLGSQAARHAPHRGGIGGSPKHPLARHFSSMHTLNDPNSSSPSLFSLSLTCASLHPADGDTYRPTPGAQLIIPPSFAPRVAFATVPPPSTSPGSPHNLVCDERASGCFAILAVLSTRHILFVSSSLHHTPVYSFPSPYTTRAGFVIVQQECIVHSHKPYQRYPALL